MKYWNKKSELIIHDKVPRHVYRDYKNCFTKTQLGYIDTWDYQLTCLILINNGFVIKPYANLISNIGVIGLNTTKALQWHFVPLGHFLINENKHYKAIFDLEQDLWYYEKYLPSPRWRDLPKRIYSRLKKIIIGV